MALKFNRKRNETPEPERDIIAVWPQDALDDIDDDAFARAIAEGRMAESRQLVDA